MRIQTLISTMHQNEFSLIDKMKIQSDAVVINQCDINSVEEIKKNGHNIKWINSNTRGLSISRNMALENADSDICIIADDDLEYIENYDELVLSQFEKYTEADIIIFQVEGIEKKFKTYHHSPRNINYLTSMKISSVEIAIRLEKIKRRKIQFNPLFGAGAKYAMGEESIFLIECLKLGLKIQYVPVKIAYLHMGNSTWFKGYDDEYFINKGAAFTAISKKFSIPLILQFSIRKRKLHTHSLFNVIRLMLRGRRKYFAELKE